MQCGLDAIQAIQVLDQALHAQMQRMLERRPVELAIVIPFPVLAKLPAHEQQLLAGLRPHEAEIRAQVRKALPGIARHASNQRAFTVHDLVMRERQHKALGKRVQQAEGHVMVIV